MSSISTFVIDPIPEPDAIKTDPVPCIDETLGIVGIF
jgi:hypothetical protein